METKIEKLRVMMASGEWRDALKLASSWPRLGTHKTRIERGWAAFRSPEFYRDIGKDPDELIRDGIAALVERYGAGAGGGEADAA